MGKVKWKSEGEGKQEKTMSILREVAAKTYSSFDKLWKS